MAELSLIERCRAIISSQIAVAAESIDCLKVPHPRGERKRIAGSPFHVYPELFLQVSGSTSFTLPEQRLTLLPGELCIMPRLLPHAERVSGDRDGAFSNLVMMISADGVSFHIAAESPQRKGVPYANQSVRFDHANSGAIAEALDAIAVLSWDTDPGDELSRSALTHLVTGFLFQLLVLFRDGVRVAVSGHPKVVAAKNQIALNISNPTLSVHALADWVQCSPDYLSSLFHADTGETIVRYITSKRIAMSQSLLRRSTLTVSEIAWACGYHDPAYFSRVFRSEVGMAPGAYRARWSERGISHETDQRNIAR